MKKTIIYITLILLIFCSCATTKNRSQPIDVTTLSNSQLLYYYDIVNAKIDEHQHRASVANRNTLFDSAIYGWNTGRTKYWVREKMILLMEIRRRGLRP